MKSKSSEHQTSVTKEKSGEKLKSQLSKSGSNQRKSPNSAEKSADKSKSEQFVSAKSKKSAENSKSHEKHKSKERVKSKGKVRSKSPGSSHEKKKSPGSSHEMKKSPGSSHEMKKSPGSSHEMKKSLTSLNSGRRHKEEEEKQSESANTVTIELRTHKSEIDLKITKGKKSPKLGSLKVGFVGAGKMTHAIVHGLLLVSDETKIFVASKRETTLERFKSLGVVTTTRSYDIFAKYDCDVVFLCVHGFVIRQCFKGGGTRPFAFTINYIPNQKHPLYVLSLIGGVSLTDIRQTMLDPDNPDKYMLEMHRVMLNIGIRYGVGMGAIDVELDSKQCSPVVRDVLASIIKKLDFVPENLMDAVCCVSGNGIAFCYYYMEALAEGGFKMGLDKLMATKLAAKAAQSAAQCLLESDKHPTELQNEVCARAGPATYGIHVLEKGNCAGGFCAAIEGTYRRLKQLADIEPIAELEPRDPVAKK